MQDTSTSQYELIELLTQGWDGQSQTVFLVGDPKQSIYMFRQARVERFVRTMRDASGWASCRWEAAVDGELSFAERAWSTRSTKIFRCCFRGEGAKRSRKKCRMSRRRRFGACRRAGRRVWLWHTAVLVRLSRRRNEGCDDRGRHDARPSRCGRSSRSGERRPLPEGRSCAVEDCGAGAEPQSLNDIVAELKDETKGAIPFRAVNIEPLGERQEVLDLFALTRALLHPADRVAWFAVLHAPWCGLGLADLHVLAGQMIRSWAERCVEDVVAERGDLLSEESCARLERVWPVMRGGGASIAVGLTTSQWVERTWRSLGGDAYLKSAGDGECAAISATAR